GHKMFGPTGIGVLYGKRELLEKMEPVYGGGDMIKEVYYTHSTWNDVPHKFEAGTPHIAGSIGLGAAVDYINKIGIKNIFEHNQRLTNYALQRLSKVKGIKIYGSLNPKFRNGVISFNLGDMHSHDVSTVLDEEGIAVRSGHACAMPLHNKLGVDSSVRVSFHVYNSFYDVDALIFALDKARRVFRL
ncbi:aminotransferase class V-fold PLP-dependent enzyme, partial [Candidatus Woesearchaeota archaeon]|nr:aminotransferase class V-fold PLP-dependent enzyme [Candidatus Woesearchaeota archaeon]